MKTRSIASLRSLCGLATVLAFGAAAACAPVEDREGGGDKDKPTTGTGGETSGTGGSGMTLDTGTEVKVSQARKRCAESNTAPAALRRLTKAEYENTIKDVFPANFPETWSSRLSPDMASTLGFTNNSTLLLMGAQTTKEVLDTAEGAAEAVLADGAIATNVPCAAAADSACAGTFIDTYAPKLFRRPITAEERTRYLALYESIAGKSDFKMGLKWTLVALLESPHTVYRSEIGEVQDERRVLTQFELASELSYTFANEPPDEELMGLALAGQLSDPTVLAAQAKRLIREPRGLEVVRKFFREWLEYGLILNKNRDDVPDFAAPGGIGAQMVEETRLYIDNAIFADGADYTGLMTGDFTILTKALSDFYGYGDVPDQNWARVPRPAQAGMGLLAQGAVLASTAHENATSPTLRGLLVFEKLLCYDRPKPPAGVPPIEASEAQANTTRERYELIHLQPDGCSSCHKNWEPSGFTFEQFDETGRYRADENSYPIDTAGHITIADGTNIPIANLDELAMQAATNAQMQDCFSGFLTAYMLGGGGGEICLAEPQRSALAAGDIGIEQFIVEMVNAPSFTTRR